ncbi:MAG: carboxypeptidase-like regulatory domain-containing protein [Acidobacteriia bacterium]|nr:carboxypeptidase-like regulatory domain-containing protein [Terriglobia bacterium]
MTKLFLVSLGAIALASAQQTDPANKPHVFLENKAKPPKPSNARLIDGIVKDQADNPIRGAIVQLKDLKTSKVVDFATREDGKFAFRDLSMDVNYEVTAKNGAVTSPVKKVTPFDTRKEIILTFRLEPPKEQKQ